MILKVYKKHWDKSMEDNLSDDWASTGCVLATAFKEQYPNLALECIGYTTITLKNRKVFYVADSQEAKVKELVHHACYAEKEGRAMLPMTIELYESK